MPTDSSSATIEDLLEEIAYEEGSKADAFGEMIDEIEMSDPAEIVSSDSDSTDPSMADAWDRPVLDVSSTFQNGTDGNNGTSIFAPKDGSGVLHRYALFSPALIVGESGPGVFCTGWLADRTTRAPSRPRHAGRARSDRPHRRAGPPLDRDGQRPRDQDDGLGRHRSQQAVDAGCLFLFSSSWCISLLAFLDFLSRAVALFRADGLGIANGK